MGPEGRKSSGGPNSREAMNSVGSPMRKPQLTSDSSREVQILPSVRWGEPYRSVAPVLLPHHSKTSPNELNYQLPLRKTEPIVRANFSSQVSARSEGARPRRSRSHN